MATDQLPALLPALQEDQHGVIPYAGKSLRQIDETLDALFEVDPSELTPELREEYETDLLNGIRAKGEKLERTAFRLFDWGQRAAIKRAAAQAHKQKALELEASAQRFEKDAERLKDYVLAVMRELPQPKKGVRTLEGTSATFKAKGCPSSLVIKDPDVVPLTHKNVTVTMSAVEYEVVKAVMSLDHTLASFDFSKLRAEHSINNAQVKADLTAGLEVSGADLIVGKLRLEVS